MAASPDGLKFVYHWKPMNLHNSLMDLRNQRITIFKLTEFGMQVVNQMNLMKVIDNCYNKQLVEANDETIEWLQPTRRRGSSLKTQLTDPLIK